MRQGRAAAPPEGPWQDVSIRAADRAALLVDWLNELIFRAERDRMIPVAIEPLEASDTTLRARIRGMPVAEPPALVKAATLHGVRVDPDPEGVVADVILDV